MARSKMILKLFTISFLLTPVAAFSQNSEIQGSGLNKDQPIHAGQTVFSATKCPDRLIERYIYQGIYKSSGVQYIVLKKMTQEMQPGNVRDFVSYETVPLNNSLRGQGYVDYIPYFFMVVDDGGGLIIRGVLPGAGAFRDFFAWPYDHKNTQYLIDHHIQPPQEHEQLNLRYGLKSILKDKVLIELRPYSGGHYTSQVMELPINDHGFVTVQTPDNKDVYLYIVDTGGLLPPGYLMLDDQDDLFKSLEKNGHVPLKDPPHDLSEIQALPQDKNVPDYSCVVSRDPLPQAK